MLLHCNNYAPKDPLLSPCKGEAGYEPPSYPPWGKIDYALRLRFFLSFILAFLSFFLSSSREVSVSGLPLQGDKRGSMGLSFFLFIYIYFSLYIKKKINKNNNK